MDYWPYLSPIRQLPLPYRAWACWLRNGPKRTQGTVGGSALFRLISNLDRLISKREHRLSVLRAPDRPNLTIDLRDFESFHHALPVWYRGDEELAVLRAVMATGGTYIDVGANYGAYALDIARMIDVRVIAVEPQPHLAEALRYSQRSNGFANFEVVEAALNVQSGNAVLAVGPGSGSASLKHERFDLGVHKILVPALTLDELVETRQISEVQCLKLDVEGAEASVLGGGTTVLARDHPVVIFEAGRHDTQDEVFSILRSLGYSEFWDQASFGSAIPVPPRLEEELTNVIAVWPRDAVRVRELLTTTPK